MLVALAGAVLLAGAALAGRREPTIVVGFPTRSDGTAQQRLGWVAAHEAGHAIVAWHCPLVGQIKGMFIEPLPPGGAALWHGRVDHDWDKGVSENERLAWDAVISLAGLAAETLAFGRVHTLLMRDIDDAVRCVRALCRRGVGWPLADYGRARVPIPFEVRCRPDEGDVLGRAWSVACAIVDDYGARHAALTEAIQARRRMEERQIAVLLGARPKHARACASNERAVSAGMFGS